MAKHSNSHSTAHPTKEMVQTETSALTGLVSELSTEQAMNSAVLGLALMEDSENRGKNIIETYAPVALSECWIVKGSRGWSPSDRLIKHVVLAVLEARHDVLLEATRRTERMALLEGAIKSTPQDDLASFDPSLSSEFMVAAVKNVVREYREDGSRFALLAGYSFAAGYMTPKVRASQPGAARIAKAVSCGLAKMQESCSQETSVAYANALSECWPINEAAEMTDHQAGKIAVAILLAVEKNAPGSTDSDPLAAAAREAMAQYDDSNDLAILAGRCFFAGYLARRAEEDGGFVV